MGSARAERARVAGKTSVTLLSVHKAAARLGARGDALREYTLENATLLYELDEHGRVYMLAGASSNVRNPAHNACRTPQDSALIEDLRRRRIPGLGGSSKSPEDTKQEPERPEEPPSSPETPSKPSLMRSLVRSPVEPRTYCDPLHLLRQKRRER
jgi:hypothetical protein